METGGATAGAVALPAVAGAVVEVGAGAVTLPAAAETAGATVFGSEGGGADVEVVVTVDVGAQDSDWVAVGAVSEVVAGVTAAIFESFSVIVPGSINAWKGGGEKG